MHDPKIKPILLLMCLGFQIADVITTNIILSHGLAELNPFMALAQAALGSWWTIPKFCLACLIIKLLSLSNKTRHIAYVMVLCAVPVYNNLIIISGMR